MVIGQWILYRETTTLSYAFLVQIATTNFALTLKGANRLAFIRATSEVEYATFYLFSYPRSATALIRASLTLYSSGSEYFEALLKF